MILDTIACLSHKSGKRKMKLFVLEAVSERIGTAIGEHGDDRKVVERTTEVGHDVKVEQQKVHMIEDQAEYERSAYEDECLEEVARYAAFDERISIFLSCCLRAQLFIVLSVQFYVMLFTPCPLCCRNSCSHSPLLRFPSVLPPSCPPRCSFFCLSCCPTGSPSRCRRCSSWLSRLRSTTLAGLTKIT